MKTNFSTYKQLLSFIILAVTYAGNAQEMKISLNEAKDAALKYSHDIKNGSLRIEQAHAQRQEAIAYYFQLKLWAELFMPSTILSTPLPC